MEFKPILPLVGVAAKDGNNQSYTKPPTLEDFMKKVNELVDGYNLLAKPDKPKEQVKPAEPEKPTKDKK